MSLPRAAFTWALAAAASLALLLAIQTSFAQDAEDAAAAELQIEWANRPADLEQLVEATPATVLVEVDGVRQGEAFVLDDGGPDAPAREIPTELIDVTVIETLDGHPPDQLTIFKLGGEGLQSTDDPPYSVGERHLLFIERRLNVAGTDLNEDGTWLLVAPDGRLEELSSGELDAAVDGPIAEDLEGETVPEAEEQIEAAEGSG